MGNDVVSRQVVGALEELQLDEEGDPDDLAAKLLDQARRRPGRAASRQQVIDDHHRLPRPDRMLMDLEYPRAVLERVGLCNFLTGELAFLPDWDEACIEQAGKRATEDETPPLHTDHQ